MPTISPNLILIGPPGAGKGSQATRLSEQFAYAWISTGNLFREAIARKHPIGQVAADCLRRGVLVPDELATALVADTLKHLPSGKPFLFDGYPRTTSQADALERLLREMGYKIDLVLQFVAPQHVLVARIAGRIIDPVTNRVYHIADNPPEPDVRRRMVRRIDDDPQAAANRLAEYERTAAELVARYVSVGLLRLVDATGALATVTRQVDRLIGEWRRSHAVETHHTLVE